jgi:exosortase D (VPLPA-CTERM-specific)
MESHSQAIDGHATPPATQRLWRFPAWYVVLIASSFSLLAVAFFRGLAAMVERWIALPEYSHGFLLPVVAAFLIWQRKPEIDRATFSGSWLGVAIVISGIALLTIGELSAIYTISQIAFVVTLAGLAIALMGMRSFKLVWVAVAMLFLMIPVPNFFLEGWSSKLQLLSSELGVAIMRLAGISVFLEGNVIDLGSMKLQVVEACDGLRYMFPLVSLAIVAAYFFRVSWWQRLLVVALSVPTAVVVNSLRVAMIGIFVEFGSLSLAEGFLHEFQGSVFFFLSCAALLAEMWLLSKIGRDPRPFKDIFGFALPQRDRVSSLAVNRRISRPFVAALALLGIAAGFAIAPPAPETAPARKSFLEFPLTLGDWRGRSDRLDQLYENTLLATDYLMVDFNRGQGRAANLFVAYYQSQRAGESAHSPKSCIPGGGWRIVDLREVSIPSVAIGKTPLKVNRAVIELGSHRELIYYWFQQRERVITNEYLVKWYLMLDSVARRRSDGALVRLVAPIGPNQSEADADASVLDLLRHVAPQLPNFVPG